MNEITPIVTEFAKQPIAFLGGFMSGILRLNLSEDPVKSWLNQQATGTTSSASPTPEKKGPQSISID